MLNLFLATSCGKFILSLHEWSRKGHVIVFRVFTLTARGIRHVGAEAASEEP